ncbi:MAG: UDP-N-acetylmuramoyl-L-alanine--D-glutamate ligase [Desulfonauticus sp.]|nr:UDP-N-acetylmuramoyl-L-alanine--D-glutamate ligase [Desulfonauticus sp.]
MRELIFPDQLKGHRAVVVGAGVSGLAACKLLSALGADVRLLEENPTKDLSRLDEYIQDLGLSVITGEHKKEHFQGVNLVVLSPGVPWFKIKRLVPKNVLICSELELASWFVDRPIVAITGTNGKTTTTALIAHVLSRAGKRVFVGANFGKPLSEYVLSSDVVDYLVLEVSSFQLQGVNSFRPYIALLLNFSPNHLDVHQTEQEYWEAKLKLFAKQKNTDIGIFPLHLRPQIESTPLECSKIYFVASNRFEHPLLRGQHNQANLEAAFLAVKRLGISEQEFQDLIQDFVPLEHRLEIFWKWKNYTFVNDSKSTTVASLKAALEALPAPIRLFCGGVFKGGNLNELKPLMMEKVRKVYLFGESKDFFEQAFNNVTEVTWHKNLENAVAELQQDLHSDLDTGTVLLSPATASFDLFDSYQERGRRFKDLVKTYFKEGESLVPQK